MPASKQISSAFGNENWWSLERKLRVFGENFKCMLFNCGLCCEACKAFIIDLHVAKFNFQMQNLYSFSLFRAYKCLLLYTYIYIRIYLYILSFCAISWVCRRKYLLIGLDRVHLEKVSTTKELQQVKERIMIFQFFLILRIWNFIQMFYLKIVWFIISIISI